MRFLVRIGGDSVPNRRVRDRKGQMAAEVLKRDGRGEQKTAMHASVRATPSSNTTMRGGESIHDDLIAD